MKVRFGEWTLDTAQRQLTRDGTHVHLAPKAFDLLTLLVEEAPRVVRKGELHERLWPGTFVSDATLVALVKEVRRALNDRSATAPIIRTAHRVGYAFAAPLAKDVSGSSEVSRWLVVGSRRVALVDGENVIGRDPACSIHIESAGVSRRHARILIEGRNAWLEDMGSKNGTLIGGEEVTRRTALRDGDEIRVGPVPILYRASTRVMSTETMSHSRPL
jgi:DNA-binding winged helix-turn-helix (wHTH) protein